MKNIMRLLQSGYMLNYQITGKQFPIRQLRKKKKTKSTSGGNIFNFQGVLQALEAITIPRESQGNYAVLRRK